MTAARFRLLLTDATDSFHELLPDEAFATLVKAQAEGVRQVKVARKQGRTYWATIHDLDDQGQATHWRGLNTETMTWREPKAVER